MFHCFSISIHYINIVNMLNVCVYAF